ncbi:DUF397 domain-containing protein [Amycolatopsis sp. H20-H5]|uniref:DUF397 domain-containing protein n=1 Tax=Amycolatopsis sp. H20-H5 TaxID=3046309 RepID=UPI002DB74699|nr:DUF397 domain-containing protein [Amycolatopsis sp. H20-H5]MEC3975310.1 DUF397 domain-containing protein [Amycolatopsis sp. H20-H5]
MPIPEQTRLTWHKSSYSDKYGNDCVEVAEAPATTAVRDSKAPEAGHLTLAPTAWRAFLTTLTA